VFIDAPLNDGEQIVAWSRRPVIVAQAQLRLSFSWNRHRRRPWASGVAVAARQGQAVLDIFDLGHDWTHLCTVADQRVDPIDVHGITPPRPVAYFGWGDIPDQTDAASTATGTTLPAR